MVVFGALMMFTMIFLPRGVGRRLRYWRRAR
jgi:ABC-type branched-subunit amino acid transport system permease subunit